MLILRGIHEPLGAEIYLSDLPSVFLPASQGSSIITRSCYSLSSAHRHACVIRGQVMTSDGTPLVGVNISFVNNPLFGYTISRQDGR